jgi:hypothetical protein
LMRIVDEEMPAQGSISQALGNVRWHSRGRFLSRQVSIEPGEEETLVRVEERFEHRLRAMIHAIPSSYATMLGFIVGMEQIGGAPWGIGLGIAAGAGVFAVSGRIWNWVSRRSRARVELLSDRLAADASERAEPRPSPEQIPSGEAP